jgi:hypothetical protein
MAARVVRKAWDVVMVGSDNHGGLYYYNIHTGLGTTPGPPVPYPPGLSPLPPFSFHAVLTTSAWPLGEHKTNATVIVEGDPIVSKGHESKLIPHIPPGGNLLLPITFVFSASKWVLGVGSVIAKEGPLASTAISAFGVNYNCQDPCSAPFPNLMVATSSVQVAPSGADFAAAGGEMAIQSAFEFIISAGLEHVAPWLVKKLAGKMMASATIKRPLASAGDLVKRAGSRIGRTIEKRAPRAVMDGLKRQGREAVRKSYDEVPEKAARARAKAIADAQKKQLGEEASKKLGDEAYRKARKEASEEIYSRFKSSEEIAKDAIKGGSGDVVKFGAGKAKEAASDSGDDKR